IGTSVSAVLALALMLRREYRDRFATWSGRRFDRDLFARLLRFGLPGGVQVGLDMLAFTLFTLIVGLIGPAELAATSIAFTLNLVAVLPPLGLGQAVSVLVGQRLGENRPDLAARTTWTGLALTWLYMTGVVLLYVLVPDLFLRVFHSEEDP